MATIVSYAIVVLLSATALLAFAIATTIEDEATKLLRKLKVGRRLSPKECQIIRVRGDSSSDHDERACLEPRSLYNGETLLRSLLLDGRISCYEFETIVSSWQPGVALKRRAMANNIIARCRSFRLFPRYSAVAHALRTPELVERILLYAPHQDLALHIPKTCKMFRDVTKESKSVRRRILLGA